MDFKATNEKPLGKSGKAIEKDFSSQLGKGNVNLTEVDAVLNEKEQSFKKKVWDLSKMESLVFSDPKLNARYNDMSEDGQEKYGYHYNETIMNMLFNEYVTNDAGYRQKYLNAIPAEKERRDKSGINQLQQKGEEKMQQNSAAPKAKTEADVPIHNNSLEGVIEEDGMMDNNLNTDGHGTFDDREYLNHRIEKKYDTMKNTDENVHAGIAGQHKNYSNTNTSVDQANIDAMNDTDPLTVGDYDRNNRDSETMNMDDIGGKERVSKENPFEGEIKETTGAASSGAFSTALGAKNNVYEGKETDEKRSKLYNDALNKFGFNVKYDSELSDEQRKRVSDYIKSNMSDPNHVNECEDCEEQIDETTTSSSSGAYVGSFHKKGKDHVTNKPAWKGGEIVSESYLVNTNMFKDIYNELNEGMDSPSNMSRVPMAEFDMTDDKQMQQQQLKNAYSQMENLLSTMSTNPNARKAYEEIKKTAQRISQQLGVKFNDPEKRGMFSKIKRGLGIGESEMNEDGIGDIRNSMDNLLGNINSKEEKIKLILQKGKNKFGDIEMLNHLPDNDINRIFQYVMNNQTSINPMGESKLRKPELKPPQLRESVGKLKSVKDFAAKYNLTPTGNNNKYKIADFQPILTNPIDKDDQYDLAMLFATNVLSRYMMDWNDLGDINSLWDVVEGGHKDMKSFVSHVKELAHERLNDVDSEFGGMFGEGEVNEKAKSKKQGILQSGQMNEYFEDPSESENSVEKDYLFDAIPIGKEIGEEKVEDFYEMFSDKKVGKDEWFNWAKLNTSLNDEDIFEVWSYAVGREKEAINTWNDEMSGYMGEGEVSNIGIGNLDSKDFTNKEILKFLYKNFGRNQDPSTFHRYLDVIERLTGDRDFEEKHRDLLNEKAKSKKQQQFMGMVHAAQKGELENPSASVAKVAKEMKPDDVDDFASTKHKGLPDKVSVDEDLSQTVQYDSERSGEDPFEINGEKWQYVNAIYPDGTKDIGVYRFGHDLVYSFDYFNNVILGGRNDLGEGMISGTDGSMISKNPTSIVNQSGMGDVPSSGGMDDIGMGMNENGSEFDLDPHGRKDDVTFDNNNDMAEVGASHGGLSGFNDKSDGYYKEYKKPEAEGAPKNKDLGKYNSMTVKEGEEKEAVCENCGSPLDEEGHCRRDEKPVAGKLAGESGSCEKKNKKSKTGKKSDNKFNVKFRNKREKERENKIEKKHIDYKKELEQNRKHMKKLKEMVEGSETLSEDKRPSALVQMDRLHKDNAKNFKSDVKNSNSAELASDEDELTAKEQIEEVPDNAYELAEKIEKDKMKQHEFNSLNNDGNSTNDTNKDIPKRNATDDEAEDIMLNRGLGMQDIVYDNKPDERFDERMKKDMGETIYDQRQEKMKFRADAPMYNKDTQPIEKGTEETQFDKNISKFNNPKGVKENHIVAGKFVNDMNNTEFINFNINEAPVKLAPEGTKLIVEGMGNTYTQSVNENKDMRTMMDTFDFYINGGKVSKVAKGKQALTEGEEKPQINEHVQKMMKLAGYKPSDYVDTSATKKNAKFKFTGNL